MSRYLRAELVLPVTIAAAAAIVAASELMTTFEFTSAGTVQAVSTASDRHGYALLILAVLTVVGMVYAIVTGLRSAAVATAVLGCTALLLFLVLDLPDAGKVGPLDDDPGLYFADARADPATGFWLEAVGTVVLGLATVAFATLSSAQLRAPAELIASHRRGAEETATTADEPGRNGSGPAKGGEPGPKPQRKPDESRALSSGPRADGAADYQR